MNKLLGTIQNKKNTLKKSPTGTLPLLETSQGFLSEAHAISVWINDSFGGKLLGSNTLERAQVLQWCEFVSQEIQPNNTATIYAVLGYYDYNQATFNEASKNLKNHLKTLDKRLENKKYVVGSSISLADIELFLMLRYHFMLHLNSEDQKHFSHLTKWFVGIGSEEHVVRVCGVTRLGKITQKGVKIDRKPQQQKEQPKPKKEETKKEDHEEEKKGGDDEEVSKPKKKHALDLLPETSFVLDDFKRDFLNTKDKKGSLENFWKNLDKNGWSLWHLHYQKLPSEGKIKFKTTNSYSMFLQKIDNFRKYSFSVHGVYGTEGNYEIKGLWLWRGLDVAPQMKEHEAFEFFNVKKLSPESVADRGLVENYWLHINEGDVVEGLPVVEVIYFR